ncbi:MAG: flagellar hook-length control protein FliK [Thiobacillus sp.]
MTPLALLSRLIAIPPVLDAVARDAYTPPGARLTQRLSASDTLQRGGVEPESALPSTPLPPLSTPLVRDGVRIQPHASEAAPPGKPTQADARNPASTATPGYTRLSQTAHLLSSLLAHAPQQSHAEAPAAATPLLSSPPHASTELALALRTALTRSGLFYESHLADWSLGLDPLEGLMQEPQNRVSVRDPAATPTAPAISATPVRHDASGGVVSPASAVAISTATTAGHPSDSTIPPALHSLVSNQLQLLESPTLLWRGDIWPGQAMTWALQHHTLDEDRADVEAAPDTPAWTSRLKLTLPRLGELDLTLRWNQAGHLQVAIAAANPAAAQTLQAARPQAHSRLTQAGCAVTAIKVGHDAD